jgi:chromosomal replication initiator protein
MITSILAEETVLAKPIVTIDTIAQNVAKQFGVRLSLLRGSCRRTSVVVIRHVAMHLARKLTGSSFAVIGTYFGGRDPATVRYACKTILVRLSADLTLAAAVANFEASGSWIQSNARHDASQS